MATGLLYRILTGLLLSGWLVGPLNAQNVVFSGRVIERGTGGEVIGATLKLRGTTLGTITDANGTFRLTVAGEPNTANTELEVSSVGYKRRTVTATPGTDLTIELEEDAFNLDAVVVTGQGIDVSKRRLSTNVAIITARDIEKIPVPRLEQLLQAQLPTTQITFSGGQPGSTSFVRTRGIQSAFLNSTPVIYVDGVRVDNLNTYARLSLNLSGNLGQGATTSALTDIPIENISASSTSTAEPPPRSTVPTRPTA